MLWIDSFKLAEAYRESYIAILRSWVAHGERDDFAMRCGITREYLSCICALDYPNGGIPIHKRTPSSRLARKMADHLPAPIEIRQSLFEKMELAHVNALDARLSLSRTTNRQQLDGELIELEKLHRQATFSTNLDDVQRAYRVVSDTAKILLQRTDPQRFPDTFAQLCLYYHDSQCVLNRPDEALLYAKIAQVVLESADDIESGFTREQRDNLEINAIRGEAVAYHNLTLDRKAVDILSNRACNTSAYHNAKAFWGPLVMRDIINSLVETPRFSIRKAGMAARESQAICEHKNDEFTLLLVRESWLRALIKHEKIKQANRLFWEEYHRLSRLPYVGALHRALLLKSGMGLAWMSKDKTTWNLLAKETISLMQQAGLKHQFEVIRHTYGNALLPILNQH